MAAKSEINTDIKARTEEDITNIINQKFDEELKITEQEMAEKYGAVNYENDKGKEEIQEIIEEVDQMPENIEMGPKKEIIENDISDKPEINKPILKRDLIDSIRKLQAANKIPPTRQDALQKKKKIELEKMLGELSNYSMKKLQPELQQGALQTLILKSAGENMFIANRDLCYTLEHISESCKEFTENNNYLEGWTEDIENNKQVLEHTLQEIYKKHARIIENYMDPLYVWAFLMLTSASRVVAKNSLKKKIKNN